MKSLYEIIESAKDGNMPSHEECYWSMLALEALYHFESRALRGFSKLPVSLQKFTIDESFKRIKTALEKSPKDFVGWENDPSNPDYQKFRKNALKILSKATSEHERQK